MRRLTTFSCEGETLAGTLDAATGKTGLLIVTGGNEIRIGAHRGMALLAQRLAARGVPVFRFDRRGIGDSTGTNAGYRSSAPDIAAAAAAFKKVANVERIVGFGNCDAASALVLFGAVAGIDRLVLANPWVTELPDDLPPAAAIRARYAERLKDPREWVRLLRGGVDIRKLFNGLRRISTSGTHPDTTLATEIFTALADWQGCAVILLAQRDNTAITFADASRTINLVIPVETLNSASHSFASVSDADWLLDRILAAVADG